MGEGVLAALTEEERTFLLRTSVLEKLSGHLCDALMETEGSGKLLQELVHSNPFVVPLSGDRGWYRYHHLFADFLFYELESTRPDLVPVLRGRASAWFEGEGSVEAAITYAIAAGEYERAGALIARHWVVGYDLGRARRGTAFGARIEPQAEGGGLSSEPWTTWGLIWSVEPKKETLPEIPTPARRMPLAAVDALGRSIAMQVRLAQGPHIT